MRAILVLALIGTAYAVPRQPTRIIGGESTNIERYPFMASTLLNWVLEIIPICGGTLITRTAVVSAAHCYINDPPTLWQVRLGSTFDSFGGNVHTVSRIILHEQFNKRLMINDLAVIRLTNPAVFSNKINPARIAGPRYVLSDNTLVHAIGWGATEWENDSSENLQHVAVHIINQKICTEGYAYLKTLPEFSNIPEVIPDMLCTGFLNFGGNNVCQGDFGGPVIHNRDILVGITSWGHDCTLPTYPGVSVRVSSYSDWIYSNSIN